MRLSPRPIAFKGISALSLIAAALLLMSCDTARSEDKSETSHEMYLQLQRQAESFVGQPLSFAGKVIQSLQSGQGYLLWINVTPGNYNSWQDTGFVEYTTSALVGRDRITEGDLVSVRGIFTGIKSYQSVLGETIRLPAVVACTVRSGLENIPACPGER